MESNFLQISFYMYVSQRNYNIVLLNKYECASYIFNKSKLTYNYVRNAKPYERQNGEPSYFGMYTFLINFPLCVLINLVK